MTNGDLVTERRGVSPPHHVHDAPILDVCASPNLDAVDVASQNGVHPNAAVGADNDIADDLGTLIDESGRCNARIHGPVRSEHSEDYTRAPDSARRVERSLATKTGRLLGITELLGVTPRFGFRWCPSTVFFAETASGATGTVRSSPPPQPTRSQD